MEKSSKEHEFQVLPDGQGLVRLLKDIFTPAFMKAHTSFESFEGFRYSSAVIVNWEAETLVYSATLLDHFVRESTEFSCWDELVRAAVKERYHTLGEREDSYE